MNVFGYARSHMCSKNFCSWSQQLGQPGQPAVMQRRAQDALTNWGRLLRNMMLRHFRIRHHSSASFVEEVRFLLEHSSESSDDRDHDYFVMG